jgi:predicted NBD/HSP70 family sugar kinase
MAPASPSTARALNDRLALGLLQQEGPLTAGQLKTLTGLSRPTIADLVERLQETGLIRMIGESDTKRRGPNARLYAIVADQAHLAAVDVRMDSVTVLVSDLLGTPLAEATLPIEAEAPAVYQTVALIARTAREAGADRLHTIGIGAPGLIDPVLGELRDSAQLPAWHRSLASALHGGLHAAVLVENETNLAAVAEHRFGAAADHASFVMMWLSHGVGGAIMLDGKVLRGASGGAGELGFLPVPGTVALPSRSDCKGGLHSLVGSPAVTELAASHGVFAEATAPEPPGAAVVRAAVASATPDADAFLDALAERLALGAAAVSAVLDPGCLVLGGEIGHAGGEALARRVEAHLRALSPLETQVRATTLGGAAVLKGALLAAQSAAQESLFPSGR